MDCNDKRYVALRRSGVDGDLDFNKFPKEKEESNYNQKVNKKENITSLQGQEKKGKNDGHKLEKDDGKDNATAKVN